MLAPAPQPASFTPRATEFRLSNDMHVVVVPHHRVPVVTHMVWYKAGAADGRIGASGMAHFLEHLMFKSTGDLAAGELTKFVVGLGGQENAFTNLDVTVYFQRVPKQALATVMGMEADRMVNLRIVEGEVATERQVIMEERAAQFGNLEAMMVERMTAALYLQHPYGSPVIGWGHEIAKLSREDVLDFYRRHYAPNNAVLVVAGDVDIDAVKQTAEEIYGKIAPNPNSGAPSRPVDPPHVVARRLTLKDHRLVSAKFQRFYATPGVRTARPGEVEALDLLFKILAQGPTSRLHRALVASDDGLASNCDGGHFNTWLDSGSMWFSVTAGTGAPETIEDRIDDLLEDVRRNGVTELEVERAKKARITAETFASGDQLTLANRYGWALATGRTIDDVENWRASIARVTSDEVRKVARMYLDLRRSVTGWLLPSNRQAGVGDSSRLSPPSATQA